MSIPLDETGCPDLQALVERAGRRHAAAIGEQYIEDPFRRGREAPHQGGYQLSIGSLMCSPPGSWSLHNSSTH